MDSQDLLDLSIEVIKYALKKMNSNRSLVENCIIKDALKPGGEYLLNSIHNTPRFTYMQKTSQ